LYVRNTIAGVLLVLSLLTVTAGPALVLSSVTALIHIRLLLRLLVSVSSAWSHVIFLPSSFQLRQH
jgi:hypothetical protein